MKIISPKYFLWISIFVTTFLLTESCKQKGCMDKEALNYNLIADKDDGSCYFCDSTFAITGFDSVDLMDNNSASLHYGEHVARFYVTQKSKFFNDASCGEDSCNISFTIKNLLNQDVQFGSFSFDGGSSMFFDFNYATTIYFTANEIKDMGKINHSTISNPCGSFASASFSATSSSITYP